MAHIRTDIDEMSIAPEGRLRRGNGGLWVGCALALILLSVGVWGCDNSAPAKVPIQAGRGLGPAAIRRAIPDPPVETDAVVAWVNETPIHASEVDEELRHMRSPDHGAAAAGHRAHVIQRLIDEELVAQWVDASSVEIGDDEVDAAVDAAIGRVFGTREALLRHLDDHGSSLEQYRTKLRRDLATARLLDRPDDDEERESLSDLYREVANRPATTTVARISSVLFDRTIDEREAKALVAKVHDEHGFSTLPGRKRALGWVERSALGEGLAREIMTVSPPGISQPVQTPAGFETYWIHEREERPTAHFKQIEPILRRQAESMEVSEARAKLVRELRSKAKIRIVDEPE